MLLILSSIILMLAGLALLFAAVVGDGGIWLALLGFISTFVGMMLGLSGIGRRCGRQRKEADPY